MKIKIGDSFVMPEPNIPDDSWTFGGFRVRVTDILDNGTVIVEDQDSDFFTIEAKRLIERA